MERHPAMGDEHESERKVPEIEWQGPLDGGHENPVLWRGGISAKLSVLKNRLALNEDSAVSSRLERAKQALNHYYIHADASSQVRCIDGRGETDTPEEVPSLGPQTSGGTPVNALCYRFASGFESVNESNAEQDLERYEAVLKRLGLPYPPGAHEDEYCADSDDKTGCGAIDKMLEILEAMESEELRDYAAAIAGQYFSDEIFMDLRRMAASLSGQHLSEKYFMKEHGKPRSGKKLVERVRHLGRLNGHKSVERLCGQHNEVFLVVNTVQGETFNRDQFAHDNGNTLQAFNYDFWLAVERAEAIFSDNEYARNTFITANAMYAVATAMTLTDGSLELGIRQ